MSYACLVCRQVEVINYELAKLRFIWKKCKVISILIWLIPFYYHQKLFLIVTFGENIYVNRKKKRNTIIERSFIVF